MARRGRKTLDEELSIKQRYSDLSVPFFKVLKQRLNSRNRKEQDWAIEQLSKGFVKMIPQVLEGDKENPLMVMPIFNGKSLQNNNSSETSVPTGSTHKGC